MPMRSRVLRHVFNAHHWEVVVFHVGKVVQECRSGLPSIITESMHGYYSLTDGPFKVLAARNRTSGLFKHCSYMTSPNALI